MRGTAYRNGFVLVAVCALLIAYAPSAGAQSQAGNGQIVGTVYDSTGATVPKATVKLENKALAINREMTAGDEGNYRFILLPPGKYTVIFTHTGFKTYKAEVEVTVGSTVTVNATLAVGEVTQVVEVIGTPGVETTTTVRGTLINEKSISDLPINGRRFHDFVTLTPTVQIESQRSGISFAGQRGINSNITIDGADHNEPFFGGMRGGERSSQAFSIPQESIAQFQIVPYGYSAEFGRSTGGIMNAVTKSGSNEYHGSVFYFNRDGSLAKKDARNRQAVTDQQQFGGSIGGPVIHDKTFAFFAYEQQINNNPRQVIFRRLDGFTPNASQLEAFCFLRVISGCPSGSTGREEPFTQTNDARTFLVRGDQQFGSNHRVAMRYHYSKNEAKNAVATGEAIGPETNRTLESNGTEGDQTHTVTGSWTAIFSPRVVNEFRGVWSKEARPRTANAEIAGFNSSIGDTGTRSFLSTTLDDYRVQVANNLNWTLGTHSLKFGGDFNQLHAKQFFKFNQFGLFTFTTTDTATLLNILSVGGTGSDPANRFDSSAVRYNLNIGNGQLELSGQELAFFILDTWRITPRFTLTAGFRWEGYLNPSPDVSNTALYNSVKNFPFPIGRTVDPAIIPDNLRQYMPRVGFAWDPAGKGKSVIRASAGIYYAQTPLLLYAGPLNNFRLPAGDLTVQLPISVIGACPAAPPTYPGTAPATWCTTVFGQFLLAGINLNNVTLGNLPTLTPANFAAIGTGLGLTPDPFRGSQPLTWANNYESPRSWQWSVGTEHELARNWTVGADFVYINTVHLQRNRDLNLPVPIVPANDLSGRPCFRIVAGTAPCGTSATGTPAGTGIVSRPISTLSAMTLRDSTARSLYRGLTLSATRRGSRYQVQAYYTLGYNNSDDDNERSAGGFTYDNAFNLLNEYGPSVLDTRHQVAISGIWNLPAGFTVSGGGRFSSSRPFEPIVASDSNGDNSRFTDRAFQATGVTFGRNSFRDRAIYATDMRFAWDAFTLLRKAGLQKREGMELQITADIFNIFSYDNVTYGSTNQEYGLGISPTTGAVVPANTRFQRLRVSTACLSPTNLTGNKNCYDTVNNVGSPFQMQLGIRFQF